MSILIDAQSTCVGAGEFCRLLFPSVDWDAKSASNGAEPDGNRRSTGLHSLMDGSCIDDAANKRTSKQRKSSSAVSPEPSDADGATRVSEDQEEHEGEQLMDGPAFDAFERTIEQRAPKALETASMIRSTRQWERSAESVEKGAMLAEAERDKSSSAKDAFMSGVLKSAKAQVGCHASKVHVCVALMHVYSCSSWAFPNLHVPCIELGISSHARALPVRHHCSTCWHRHT